MEFLTAVQHHLAKFPFVRRIEMNPKVAGFSDANKRFHPTVIGKCSSESKFAYEGLLTPSIVSDADTSITAARRIVWPNSDDQLCFFHVIMSLKKELPKTGPKNSILNLCPSVMTEEQLKQRAKSQAHRCKDPVERFKYICLSNGLTTIKNLLRSFERDGITLEGFIAAINNCGLHLSNEDAKLIFAQISKDQANLSIDDFVIAIQPSVNSTRTELIEKAFKLVANGKEFATVDDLKTAYNYKKQPQYLSGQKTKEEITEIFLKLFDARSTKME
uniref:Uncharacterized protein n=1 Tax=Ditylenchus dipsaci TaxID=166011 RepID=A0A915E0A8_9BILA